MKTYKFYIFSFLFAFSAIYPCLGQETGFPPIEPDESFEPYVRFDEETGRYYIGHLRDADTGEVYEAVYEPPTLISPTFNMSLERLDGNYTYSYLLANGIESRQGISSFKMEVKEQFLNLDLPESWYFREFRTEPFIRVVHRITDIPEYDENEPIYFSSDLSPGDSLQFNIESEFPPSIIDIFISGRPTVLNFHFVLAPTPEVQDLRDSLRTQVENADHRGVLVKSIGPQAPPDPFNHLDFLDSLRSYIPQAYELDWIEDQAFTNNLENLLDEVRSYLSAGDSSAVTDPLETFIQLVEQTNNGSGQPGAELTSEGYALLYYNAKYLIERKIMRQCRK